ncbi:hypothetical protein MRX96_032227 [Rhipicephalus microplus]
MMSSGTRGKIKFRGRCDGQTRRLRRERSSIVPGMSRRKLARAASPAGVRAGRGGPGCQELRHALSNRLRAVPHPSGLTDKVAAGEGEPLHRVQGTFQRCAHRYSFQGRLARPRREPFSRLLATKSGIHRSV